MESTEYIDPSRRTQKELILKLLDKVDELEKVVNKYIIGENKELRERVEKQAISIAVIQAKAAAYGSAAGLIVSIIAKYVL